MASNLTNELDGLYKFRRIALEESELLDDMLRNAVRSVSSIKDEIEANEEGLQEIDAAIKRLEYERGNDSGDEED